MSIPKKHRARLIAAAAGFSVVFYGGHGVAQAEPDGPTTSIVDDSAGSADQDGSGDTGLSGEANGPSDSSGGSMGDAAAGGDEGGVTGGSGSGQAGAGDNAFVGVDAEDEEPSDQKAGGGDVSVLPALPGDLADETGSAGEGGAGDTGSGKSALDELSGLIGELATPPAGIVTADSPGVTTTSTTTDGGEAVDTLGVVQTVELADRPSGIAGILQAILGGAGGEGLVLFNQSAAVAAVLDPRRRLGGQLFGAPEDLRTAATPAVAELNAGDPLQVLSLVSGGQGLPYIFQQFIYDPVNDIGQAWIIYAAPINQVINFPFQLALGRDLIGNGVDGYAGCQVTGLMETDQLFCRAG